MVKVWFVAFLRKYNIISEHTTAKPGAVPTKQQQRGDCCEHIDCHHTKAATLLYDKKKVEIHRYVHFTCKGIYLPK